MTLNTYQNWEGQVIEVTKNDCLQKSINIVNIYRPPRELVENYKDFITEFTPIVASLEKTKCESIITGNFNINVLELTEKSYFAEYFDLLTGHGFYPKITLPTHFSNKRGTLIDNLFCKLTDSTLDTSSGILIKIFSDHQPYFTILNNITHKETPIKYVKVTKSSKDCLQNMENDLYNSPTLLTMNSRLNLDPNVNYNKLQS